MLTRSGRRHLRRLVGCGLDVSHDGKIVEAASVAQQGHAVVRHRFVEGNASLVGRIEILRQRQPLDQHGSVPRGLLQPRNGVPSVRIDACPEKKIGIFADLLGNEFIRNIELGIAEIKFAVLPDDAVERQHHRRRNGAG